MGSLFLNFFDICLNNPGIWSQKFAAEVTKLWTPDEIRRFDGSNQWFVNFRVKHKLLDGKLEFKGYEMELYSVDFWSIYKTFSLFLSQEILAL